MILTIDNIWNIHNNTKKGREHLKKNTEKNHDKTLRIIRPNTLSKVGSSSRGSFYLPPKAFDFFHRIYKAMASRTTTGITRRVVMRTMGTPKPGSLIRFCFSCIFCNSVEAGLFSILVSTTASDSSGKEEFTIFN